ncbi:MAG: hypothetical protein GF350_16130 [Chitinivibrionales bacterium]|nr:hypothetical protein [Chitinivibrionales bacterium]
MAQNDSPADSLHADDTAAAAADTAFEFCVFWYEDSLFENFLTPVDDSLAPGCPDYSCTGLPHELWGIVKHHSLPPETLHCRDSLCTIRGQEGTHNISWYFLYLIEACKQKKLRHHRQELDSLKKAMER